jgi:hypothetical protein
MKDIKKVIKKRKIDKEKNANIIDKSGINYLIYFNAIDIS